MPVIKFPAWSLLIGLSLIFGCGLSGQAEDGEDGSDETSSGSSGDSGEDEGGSDASESADGSTGEDGDDSSESGSGDGTDPGCAVGDATCVCAEQGCREGECREDTGTCVLEVDGMVWSPEEVFYVGCEHADCPPESQPRRGMFDPWGVWLDVHEVTVGEYRECVDAGGCVAGLTHEADSRVAYTEEPGPYEGLPINGILWTEAMDYCEFRGKRLPAEPEWEKVARGARAERTYPWGDAAPTCDHAILDGCWDDVLPSTPGLAALDISAFGARDMAGNLQEWTYDVYVPWDEHMGVAEPFDGPPYSYNRVMRGGSHLTAPDEARAYVRSEVDTDIRAVDYGFRCAYQVEY